MYVHQLAEWPAFYWDDQRLSPLLADVKAQLQSLSDELSKVGFDDAHEATLRNLTNEVVKTSEIEGKHLDPDLVRSSIASKLGLSDGGVSKNARSVEGIVSVVLDATQNCFEPLTEKRLFGWHSALFPSGFSDLTEIIVGNWRDDDKGPMEVVSGRYGNKRVHFQAPEHIRLPKEMQTFLEWFNTTACDTDLILKAGVAHFWFVTIHPFADGNGRIARAIADLVLAQADGRKQRYYSMSTRIKLEQLAYYEILESSQKGTLDITDWLVWFLNCLKRAMENAGEVLADIIQKARVWEVLNTHSINDPQRRIMNMLLDKSFDGKLSTQKYAKINNVSLDTAARHLNKLVDYGALKREGLGKATRYELQV